MKGRLGWIAALALLTGCASNKTIDPDHKAATTDATGMLMKVGDWELGSAKKKELGPIPMTVAVYHEEDADAGDEDEDALDVEVAWHPTEQSASQAISRRVEGYKGGAAHPAEYWTYRFEGARENGDEESGVAVAQHGSTVVTISNAKGEVPDDFVREFLQRYHPNP